MLPLTGSNTDHSESLDVCSLQNDMDCSRETISISCTSIDLLANKSECRRCVSGIWMAIDKCIVEIGDMSIQINVSNGNAIVIQINESISSKCQALNASCVPSKYKYTKYFNGTSSFTEAEQNKYLFCEQDIKEKELKFNEHYYCLKKKDAANEAVCYERKGNCTAQGKKLTCTIKKHAKSISTTDSYSIIDRNNCEKIKELSNCTFKVSVNNIDINEKNSDADVLVSCKNTKPCNIPVNILCEKGISLCDYTTTTSSSPTTGPPNGGNDKGPNYTWFLIIIIVILLLLLVSYYGYQNQWHHKVSTSYLIHLVT